MQKRVVVTGMGTISPLGNDLNTTWDGIINGRSGVGPITRFDATEYRTRIGAEVKYDPLDYFPAKTIRRMDPFAQFALIAAREAIEDANIHFENGLRERTAVIVGSGIGGMSTVTAQNRILFERGPSRVSPFLIPMILPETAASMIAIEFGLRGPNMAVTSACATGANAIGEGWAMLQRDIVDMVVCGGTEAGVIEISVAGFSAARALSERNDDPDHASRPFDLDRDGFIVGEGAGIVVLETLEHAQARGAHIHGEVIGYASTDDAYHITAPEPEARGQTDCIRFCVKSAGIQANQIDYINAHGTSTKLNDSGETRAIKMALGDIAYSIPVSSTKSMTGHLLGAAGALEAIISIRAIETNIIPPTINLETPDPECDLDYVPHQARQQPVNTVLSNSFGFGGHNVSLLLRGLEEA